MKKKIIISILIGVVVFLYAANINSRYSSPTFYNAVVQTDFASLETLTGSEIRALRINEIVVVRIEGIERSFVAYYPNWCAPNYVQFGFVKKKDLAKIAP